MRTCKYFKYLVAMIIALNTSVNVFAQQRNLKIYFNEYAKGETAPRLLYTDDHPTSAYDVPLGVTVSQEGAAWAGKSRFFEWVTQDVTDRVMADFVSANDKKHSKLKLSFTNFPYEINIIQWNVMNDLLSGSLTNWFQNYNVTTKCIPVSGSGFSYTEEHWSMNIFTHSTTFNQGDIPWQSGATLNGLKSFEISEKYETKLGIGGWTWIDFGEAELNDKNRTFIKAGWNGKNDNTNNITDSDDSNWAFKVKFTLPEISARTYNYDKANAAIGQIDNTVYADVLKNGKYVQENPHIIQGYITAHAGAVDPTYDPTDQSDFHFEYSADNTKLDIGKYSGIINHAYAVGDIPVTVKLMRADRFVCSTEYTVRVSSKNITSSSPEICIGFADGKKGYDISVGDVNAQIKGFIVKNANGITPTENASGYHFEYSESSNGEIITIDQLTGDITPKKEGDVQVTAVLKNGNEIISYPYIYTLHVFAQHEGLEFRRINTYHFTNSSNLQNWKVTTYNTSSYEWKPNNLLKVSSYIPTATRNGVNDWKEIVAYSVDPSYTWRGISQEIAFDIYVPKYTMASARYIFAGNAYSSGSGRHGFELYYLNQGTQIDLATATDRLRAREWDTYTNGDNTNVSARAGSDSYNSNGTGDEGYYDRGTDNVNAADSYNHKSYTVYFAAMAYMWNSNSRIGGDASIGFKAIPEYTYYTKVTYAKNDGTGTNVRTESNWRTTKSKTETFMLFSSATTAEKNNLKRDGYTFLGWSTDPNATTPEFEFQEVITIYDNVNGGGRGPVTLYAVWQPNEYVVELRKGPESATGGTDYVVATYNELMPEGANITAPTLVGYDFNGYYRMSGSDTVYYYNKDMNSTHVWDRYVDSDLYVQARWIVHKTKIILDPRGGVNNGASVVYATYNQPMPTEGLSAPQREGYVFEGYYYEGNNGKYYNADMTSARTWYIDERTLDPQVTEITLYAKWTKVVFTVTLDADGGTLDFNEIGTWGTILERNPGSLVLQVKKGEAECSNIWCSNRINIKPGYKLLGWYTQRQQEGDAEQHPARHRGTLVYSVKPGNNFSYDFNAVAETSSPKYWNSDTKWVGTDDLTLYAHYEIIFGVENDVITFLESSPKNCVSGEDLTAALDYAKNHGSKLINTLDMTYPDTGADGLQGEGIMEAFEAAKAEAGSIVSPNALVLFTDTWPNVRKTNAVTLNHDTGNGICQDLVVTDRYSMRIPVKFNAQKASYARDAGISNTDPEVHQSQNSYWGTLCLPYPVKNKTNGVKYYWLQSTANDYMEFEEYADNAIIPANTPVLYKRTEGESSKINISENYVDIPKNISYTPVTINYADLSNLAEGTYPLTSADESIHNWEFRGNLKTSVFCGRGYKNAPADATIFATGEVYYFKQNKFTHLLSERVIDGKTYAAGKMNLYPYRAYFYQKKGSGAKISAYSILVSDEDGTLDITDMVFGDGEGDGKIYDLNGLRVMQPVKGRLYIVNGKKKIYR